jgi:4-amino-4-deoxy-L-arabinose transferase-like glycosyltransferase
LARDLLYVALMVLALRIPFLTQAIQGDDIYYLEGARHAQVDPAHPHQARYMFEGRWVDMRGHPHPPGNAWTLAALVGALGDAREVPFHLAYALFSFMAAAGMYLLARRHTSRPLLATALFCVTPAFVVNGNSLESDLPFLAFWLLGMASFFEAAETGSRKWLTFATASLAISGLMAYQSVLAAPILWMMLWTKRRDWRMAYVCALAPALAILSYQAFETWSGGKIPLAVTAGYFEEYGLQKAARKLRSAAALLGHLGWMVFPALVLIGLRTWWMLLALPFAWLDASPLYWLGVAGGLALLLRDSRTLGWWPQIYFGGIAALTFAGSARYLLPLAAPLALLVTRRWESKPRWLHAGLAAQAALALGLTLTNYEHWDGYRRFIAEHAAELQRPRVWTNGEWGLRYYGADKGALPIERGQGFRDGDLILSSALSYPVPLNAQRAEVARRVIEPTLPLRLIGMGSSSGYSDATAGVRPFDWVDAPLDTVRLERIVERKPVKAYLTMRDEAQLLSGFYQLEDGGARWIGKTARAILKPAKETNDVTAVVYVPPMAMARSLRISVNGREVKVEKFPKDGLYTIVVPGVSTGMGDVVLALECDAVFSVSGDARELGLIVKELGLR